MSPPDGLGRERARVLRGPKPEDSRQKTVDSGQWTEVRIHKPEARSLKSEARS
jgi:hypothetical protein